MLLTSPLDYIGADWAAKIWTDVLWVPSEDSPPVADRLMAQLFILWKILRSQKRDTESGNTALQLLIVSSSIKETWDGYQKEAEIRGESLQYESSGKTVYRDGSTALVVAYFATAQLMLFLAGSKAQSLFSLTIKDPCKVILSCASYLFRMSKFIGCAGLSMVLPLTLVALHGTSSRYRNMAYKDLANQLRGTPFRCLGQSALQRVKSGGSQDLFRLEGAHECLAGT